MKGYISAAVALAVLAAAAPAGADDFDTLRSECARQLKLSASGCDCVVASAKSDLNDQERSLVVAHVTQDQKAIMAKQSGMSGDSVMKSMMFLAQTPQKCASQ
ncbi:MAG: hypothetical protein H6907_06915 [Hyphomicrobiales bacterium]|nr:hypothetical protein [Hyphomicrobiales bacterium]